MTARDILTQYRDDSKTPGMKDILYTQDDALKAMDSWAALQTGERDERIKELEDANAGLLKLCDTIEAQRKEWADMCIRKQARIEALENQIKG